MKTKPDGYWNNKENVFKAAKKYKTRNEFDRGCCGAYKVARRNGWLDEMTWFISPHKPNGYWTKEKVFEEAKKYQTKTEFHKGCGSAHTIAIKNKWISEMDWFVKPNISKKWNRETVFEEAKKYQTRTEFRQYSIGAYAAARRNGWLDEMTWFISPRKPNDYWTKEKVFEEAKKYQTKNEFQKGCCGAYKVARKNGWFDEMDWFVKPNISKKWTKEKVFEEARKYQTKNEFQKGCSGAYQAARKNGWFDEMDWFVDGRIKLFMDNIDCVYKYFWKETNSVYVGRTINKEKRNRNHLNDKTDVVYKHSKENNLAVPPMEIIEDNLTLEEGLDREDYWVQYYKENGYNVLNKGKTGVGVGSLGAINFGKWNRETVFEEARKYQTRTEFRKGCRVAYDSALSNGWLSEMDWLEIVYPPNGYWTKERVFEDARKCQTLKEFRQYSIGAYAAARRNGWLDEMDWIEHITCVKRNKKKTNFWTKERVFEESKKYKSRGEFGKCCGGAYNVAWKNGWLDEMGWLSKNWNRKWNRKTVFEEAKKYQTKSEFSKGCSGAYNVAWKNGWLNEIFPKHHCH